MGDSGRQEPRKCGPWGLGLSEEAVRGWPSLHLLVTGKEIC
jgi:hypothetical protein